MKISELTDISMGYPLRGRIQAEPTGEVCVVQMKNVNDDNVVDWRGCDYINLPGKKDPDYLQADDILVAARGNLNYAVLVDQIVKDIKAVAAPVFYVLRLKDNRLISEYLAWYLNQQPCRQYFESTAEGSAAKSLRRAVLEDLTIPVPELQRQKTLVKLVRLLNQEKQLVQRLLLKNQQLQNTLASDTLSQYTKKINGGQ